MQSIQTYATLSGLVLDILGVVLLARELIEAAVGGTRRLVAFQRDMNLAHATRARAALDKAAVAKAEGANWFITLCHEVGLALRRADARIYDEQVKKARTGAGLQARSMLMPDGHVDVEALLAHSAEMDEYYRELGETGTIRPGLSRLAFGLIIAGFLLQFFGALPLG